MDKETRDFVMSVVSDMDSSTDYGSAEQAQKIVRENLDAFDLDGGWSSVFTNDSFDLRLFDGSVWIVPWDRETEQHNFDDEWAWFTLAVYDSPLR